MTKPEIEALLERVKAATGPDRELDEAIRFYFDPVGSVYYSESSAYTASIDAALALVERMLPGRWAEILRTAMDDLWASTTGSKMPMKLLPRFVIAALLTALEAQP